MIRRRQKKEEEEEDQFINVDGGFGEYFSEFCIIKVYITFFTVMIFGGAINIKFCYLGPHCISIVKQVFEEKN